MESDAGGGDASPNSVYTRTLLPILKTPGLSLPEIATRVRDQAQITQQNQTIALLLRDFETSASDWLWQTDPDGRLTYVSDRLIQLTGMPRDTLLGRSIAETGGRVLRTRAGWDRDPQA